MICQLDKSILFEMMDQVLTKSDSLSFRASSEQRSVELGVEHCNGYTES